MRPTYIPRLYCWALSEPGPSSPLTPTVIVMLDHQCYWISCRYRTDWQSTVKRRRKENLNVIASLKAGWKGGAEEGPSFRVALIILEGHVNCAPRPKVFLL
jgi:hypothetical protein